MGLKKTDAQTKSADAVLLAFPGFVQPALENRLVFSFHFEEYDTRTHVGLGVDNLRFGLEIGVTRGNLDQYEGSHREWIHHVQIAAVKAQLAYARNDAHVGSLFDQLGAGDERISWRAAAFCSQ